MTYLLDTNVVSELRKPRPDPGVARWFDAAEARELHLSVLVVGEIAQGIERLRLREPMRAGHLDTWLEGLQSRFADRIAPITTEVCLMWGRINAVSPLPVVDGLLAATALTHRWTLVSRNERDLARSGVRLLNPFDR